MARIGKNKGRYFELVVTNHRFGASHRARSRVGDITRRVKNCVKKLREKLREKTA
jgi:hypothetical protein